MPNPWHIITKIETGGTEHTEERLVDAETVHKAIAHVVKHSIVAERASAENLMRLARLGVEVEKA